MTTNSDASSTDTTADREIVVMRTLNAPRDLVFAAWTDATHVSRWYGPNGFTITTHEMDVRVGGVWRFIMHGPDGTDFPNRIIYSQVQAPALLTYAHDDGGKVGADAINFHTTVTFEEVGDKTRLTMRSVFPTAEMRERVSREFGAVEGGIQCVSRFTDLVADLHGGDTRTLTAVLPNARDIILHRVFDAPRELVYRALTTAEHIPHWWGCRTFTTEVREMDVRVGGRWHFVQQAPDGTVHPFRGEYRELIAPERIVQTFIYDVEGIRDHVSTETMTLDEIDGQTVLTTVVRHDSQASRDGHFHSGMTSGAAESFDRLAEWIAE